jgi:2,5-dihydroxypyridine 5,6-dioxygenase
MMNRLVRVSMIVASLSACTGRPEAAPAIEGQPAAVTRDQMMKGARKLVSVSTDVQPGENVLIVADAPLQSIAEVLVAAVLERGAEPVVAVIRQRGTDAAEPPPSVAAAMKSSQVIFSAVSISITHTQAMKDALAAGARAVALTAFTEGMLASGGIDADFVRIREDTKAVGERLSRAKLARITSGSGTDLTFSVEMRRVNVMPGIVGPGQLSPVPNAEVNVSPVEGTANGTLVVDASIPYLGIGLLKEPIRFTVRDGMITDIQGGDPAQAETLRSAWQQQADPNVYNIAEMGIGMNPMCRFLGLMLEDEGVLGSIHIGTGTNITLGGNVKARSHYDLIMSAPTLILDGEVLIQDGQIRM